MRFQGSERGHETPRAKMVPSTVLSSDGSDCGEAGGRKEVSEAPKRPRDAQGETWLKNSAFQVMEAIVDCGVPKEGF